MFAYNVLSILNDTFQLCGEYSLLIDVAHAA